MTGILIQQQGQVPPAIVGMQQRQECLEIGGPSVGQVTVP
jgi:hypothetical protein